MYSAADSKRGSESERARMGARTGIERAEKSYGLMKRGPWRTLVRQQSRIIAQQRYSNALSNEVVFPLSRMPVWKEALRQLSKRKWKISTSMTQNLRMRHPRWGVFEEDAASVRGSDKL